MPRKGKRKVKKDLISKDKFEQANNDRDIVILFADVVGCSEISNHKDLMAYNKFLTEFHEHFTAVCEHYKTNEYKSHEHPFFQYEIRGDEGCLKIFVPREKDSLAKDIDIAINIALDLKRKWLFTPDNKTRIKDNGLLPTDIGIGIHAGKVYVNKEDNGEYRPEGYAINLAKRIEGESRDGKSTHIIISESARGELYKLHDESAYSFDKSYPIKPKGISREIRVFEVRHHFLPTDWQNKPSEVSIIYGELDDDKVEIVELALKANPTNLWLAEECIMLSMMNVYKNAEAAEKEEDVKSFAQKYAPALEIARQLAYSEQGDAVVFTIWGYIYGEQENYEVEQQKYKKAWEIDNQSETIYWYWALSMSYNLKHQCDSQKVDFKKFYVDNKEDVNDILKKFENATELSLIKAWILYDYACELSYWSDAEKEEHKKNAMRKKAIDMLIRALNYHPDIKDDAKEEDYLKPIIDDHKVKKYL